MKVIDGTNAVMGRMASYVAKELLKGEEVVILNCDDVIVTGNKRSIKEEFEEKRTKVGSGQKGPKYPRGNEKIVKRCVRGMLPNHRKGRGKELYKKLKCYNGTPKEFEESKKIVGGKDRKIKFSRLREFSK